MIGLLLALVLQADSPAPSATPSPTPRAVPTARPLPQPTPPYVIAPKGWARIPFPPHRSAADYPRIAGWTRFTDRGEESIVVRRIYSSGRTAQGIARQESELYIGRPGYPTLLSSKARALCGGTVPGWEVISRDGTGLGSHTTDMLYAADSLKGYTVEYRRESAYPPDRQAVVALRSFCPTRARITSAAIVRSAIVVPHSWSPEDVSFAYHAPAGSMTLYRIPYDDQVIMVMRLDSPYGVSADVNADIDVGLAHMAPGSYTVLSRRALQLCDGDGWLVEVRRSLPHEVTRDTVVFHFGAPSTYVAVYRRGASSRTIVPAIKAVSTLCPPK